MGSNCSCCTQHSQSSLMFLLSVHRKWLVSVHNIHSQASCLFCQRTGSDHSSCVQHSQSSLMSLLSAHKKWPQFLCTAFTDKPAMWVSRYMNTQKMTPVPMCSIHSQACDVGLLSKMTAVPRQACNVGLTPHLHWRCAFACDGACPSLKICLMFVYVCFVCGETAFVDQLEKGFIYEKSSEICICLYGSLIVVRWPCAVDRMLKSSY